MSVYLSITSDVIGVCNPSLRLLCFSGWGNSVFSIAKWYKYQNKEKPLNVREDSDNGVCSIITHCSM